MDTYKLDDNLLSPFCRSYFNPEKNKIFRTNSIETISCCMETCKNHIDFCFDQCFKKSPDSSDCLNKCDQIVNICESSCMLIPSVGLRNTINCAEEKGCGSRPPFSIDCIKKHKKDIIECCKNKCSYINDNDCEADSCSHYYSFFSGEIPYPNKYSFQREKSENKDDNKQKYKSNREFFYIVFTIVFLLFILFIIVYMLK